MTSTYQIFLSFISLHVSTFLLTHFLITNILNSSSTNTLVSDSSTMIMRSKINDLSRKTLKFLIAHVTITILILTFDQKIMGKQNIKHDEASKSILDIIYSLNTLIWQVLAYISNYGTYLQFFFSPFLVSFLIVFLILQDQVNVVDMYLGCGLHRHL